MSFEVCKPDVVKTYLLAEPQESAILVSIRNGFGKESHMFLRRCKRRKNGKANRIWVMDRGTVSQDNLRFVRQRGGSYIVGTPKAMLRQFEQYLVGKDWREVQEGVEVKITAIKNPAGKARLTVSFKRNKRWSDWASGCRNGCDGSTRWYKCSEDFSQKSPLTPPKKPLHPANCVTWVKVAPPRQGRAKSKRLRPQ